MIRLLASLLLCASLLLPGQGWAATFGDTVTAGKSASSQAQIIAVKFTAPNEAGAISKISLYGAATGSATNVWGALYADSSSLPHGARLATSASAVSVSVGAAAWYDITLNYAFAANEVIWIAFYADPAGSFQCYQSAGSTDQTAYGFTATFPTFPDPGNSANTIAWTIALYATYTPAGGVNFFPRRGVAQ